MNDCVNAEMRDRLPDLLHERLDAAARAAVLAHVEECTDCRAELALLRRVHGMMTKAAPSVDAQRIAQAIPARRVSGTRWAQWGVAAAVVFLIGGASFVLMNDRNARTIADSTMASAQPSAAPGTPTLPTPGVAPMPGAPTGEPRTPDSRQVTQATGPSSDAGLEMTGRLGELTDDELRLLLKEIDEMEAVLLPDPEPSVIPVTTKSNVPAGS